MAGVGGVCQRKVFFIVRLRVKLGIKVPLEKGDELFFFSIHSCRSNEYEYMVHR